MGSSEEISIHDLAGLVAAATGPAKAARRLWDPSGPNGQPRRRLATERTRAVLELRGHRAPTGGNPRGGRLVAPPCRTRFDGITGDLIALCLFLRPSPQAPPSPQHHTPRTLRRFPGGASEAIACVPVPATSRPPPVRSPSGRSWRRTSLTAVGLVLGSLSAPSPSRRRRPARRSTQEAAAPALVRCRGTGRIRDRRPPGRDSHPTNSSQRSGAEDIGHSFVPWGAGLGEVPAADVATTAAPQ